MSYKVKINLDEKHTAFTPHQLIQITHSVDVVKIFNFIGGIVLNKNSIFICYWAIVNSQQQIIVHLKGVGVKRALHKFNGVSVNTEIAIQQIVIIQRVVFIFSGVVQFNG